MTSTSSSATKPDFAELAECGLELYRARLQSILEPERNGETVAIHLDTGDFAVGSSSPAALRALRRHRPRGMVMTRIIGPDRPDPTLYRMIGAGLGSPRE